MKQDIRSRFSQRAQAERYRDRFKSGRRLRTHQREAAALDQLLRGLGRVETVLDVPSGTGRLSPVLAAHAERVIQADSSIYMLALSREDSVLNGRSAHVQVDAFHLPLGDGAVDLVFCHRLLNHLPDPAARRAVLAELARVTRRYVVLSSLTPPRLVSVVRTCYRAVFKPGSADRNVSPSELMDDARAIGLQLRGETPIRAGLRSAVFLTFGKP